MKYFNAAQKTFGRHPERTGLQTLFGLWVVSRKNCGCFSVFDFLCSNNRQLFEHTIVTQPSHNGAES